MIVTIIYMEMNDWYTYTLQADILLVNVWGIYIYKICEVR